MESLEKTKQNMLQTAAYDTFLQIGLRILSCILNAFIVRCISQALFAVMTVRLHLLYAMGLLLSREAFRKAALGSKCDITKVINLMWIGTAAAIPVCGLGGYIWTFIMDSPPLNLTSHYDAGVLLMMISIIIEVATETPFIICELLLWARPKVFIEGAMQLIRSVILAVWIYCYPESAVLGYGVAQVTGSLVYFLCYYILLINYYGKKTTTYKRLLPDYSVGIKNSLDPHQVKVAWSFFKQGWLKEALTEGEYYLMNFFPTISLTQQGVYQIVNNLGSLTVRLVFRSIEAAAYKFFALSLQRGVPIKDQKKENQVEVSNMLQKLLKNLILISLLIITFGWSYSGFLLKVYGGASLAESGTYLMRAQYVYVIFLAINGITEAFTFAAMSHEKLAVYNKVLVIFSIAYLTMAIFLSQLFGVIGFIISNCANMLLRIIHSIFFIRGYFEGSNLTPLSALSVKVNTLMAFGSVFIITNLSEAFVHPSSWFIHLSIGGLSLIVLIVYLRHELRNQIESVLTFGDFILCKLFKLPVHKLNNQYATTKIVDIIHSILYGRKRIKKVE